MESSALCRVCLASDRAVHRLADTPLEQTYERVTREKLVVEGRPCCVCGVCLSALRRCRRFVEAAHRANIALDRWSRSRSPRAKMKLTETPLFSFSRSVTDVFEITTLCRPAEPAVKQESGDADNEDQMLQQVLNENTSDDENKFFTKDIKYEVTDDFDGDEKNNTQGSEDENYDIKITTKAESDNTHGSDDDDDDHKSQVLHSFEHFDIYEEEIDVDNKPEKLEDVELNTPEVVDNDDETAPGTSKVEQDHASSDEDIPLQSIRSRKRVKLTEDTSVPAVKKRRLITVGDQPGNTSPSPAFHKDGNMFSCRECQFKTDRKSSMKRHLMRHTGEETLKFACHKCSFKSSLKHDFKVHLLIHMGEKSFKCKVCDFKTRISTNLKRHLMIHTGEKPFKCKICDFKSSTMSCLKTHLMIHTGEKPFKCHICDYKSNRKSHVKAHLLIHTGETSFKCDKCDYKSSLKSDLKTHLMIHTGRKLFKCDKCDFKSIYNSRLKRHGVIHTGEKPFKCDKCDFKCYKKSYLKVHLMLHTGEKPFACDKCNFKSRQKTHLNTHLLTHTVEKLFTCTTCDYKCNDKSNLKKHLMIHTGEIPFKCDKCNFKSIHNSDLKKHLMIHNGEKPFLSKKLKKNVGIQMGV